MAEQEPQPSTQVCVRCAKHPCVCPPEIRQGADGTERIEYVQRV